MSTGIGRSALARRDLTQGSIVGNLWSLAWPSVIAATLNIIGPAIDMIWIGRLGAASVAGVGVSGIVVTVVQGLVSGLFMGTSAMVARFIGAKDEATANRAAQQAFVIGLLFSLLMAVVGLFLAEPILKVLGVDQAVIAEGAAYMRILLVGIITMSAVTVAQSVMQASGDAMTPMRIALAYRLLHIALCPAFVFGLWIFPKAGVSGAAYSNVISQAAGGALGMWILFTGRTRLRVTLRNFRPDWDLIWRAVRIGLPASLTFMQRSLADLILVWLMTPFGTAAVAAHSLVQRVDQFAQMPGGSMGTAAGALAGQNLGAGRPDRAARTGWLAAAMATGISVLLCLIIWFWAERIFGIYSRDSELINLSSTFLRINIVSYVFWGVVVALSMCLNGLGDTMVPMITNLVTMLGIQLGLAYYLSRYTDLGMYGVRWAAAAGIVARAFIYAGYFRAGRWKRTKV